MTEKIAGIGLGYVGLPVALAFARKFPGTVGFDINQARVDELNGGQDRTGETGEDELKGAGLKATTRIEELMGCPFLVVAVPTPVDATKRPDLAPLVKASETVGRVLTKGAVVVFESTVYPGVTEDVCGPGPQRGSGGWRRRTRPSSARASTARRASRWRRPPRSSRTRSATSTSR